MKKPFYFKIAPKAPLFKVFIYKSFKDLQPGQWVRIPFGPKRHIKGLVLEKQPQNPLPLKSIKEVLSCENSPAISPERIHWLKWMSEYYHYPLGLVADLSFLAPPRRTKKELKKSPPPEQNLASQNLLANSQQNSTTQNLLVDPEQASPPEFLQNSSLKLNPEQAHSTQQILKQKGFAVHLIHGVTGSGKTEVYKKLIAKVLQQKGQALLLLPEIFLTPQMLSRFSKSFPHQVALMHSQITNRDKKLAWQALLKGEKNLLIGTRSALFCPLPRLKLIVIDEEHDPSFKQTEKFRYHARDSAIVLAKELNIPIVLGSATPDFLSYQKALKGSYVLHELKKRAFKQTLPKVTVVDLKNSVKGELPFWLSEPLFKKISQTLKQGKQVALFLNRRGQAGALICPQCGYVKKCLNCDISLTVHKGESLLCHYCSFLEKKPLHCPSCNHSQWLEKGLGTQAVENTMEKLFPNFKTLRVDRDSIESTQDMKDFVSTVENNKAQIIVGTQMISKGLNFPSIYLVGLLLADLDFYLPDFRAEERTFQTLLQMSGRAGRTSFGEVFLQSFNPDHFSIRFAKEHDYKGFFYEIIKTRKKWFYPPFARLCLLKVDSLKELVGRDFAKQIAKKAQSLTRPGIQVLGPSPAPLAKIKSRYRFQILIKAKDHNLLTEFLKSLLTKMPKKRFTQVKIDRDPLSMF